MALRETTSLRHPQEDPLEAIEFCYSMGWTDGLPVVPPTDGMVNQFLEYVRLEPSEVVLVEPLAGRVITAEKAAANAIMAGCLKEYFPVVLAALDAMGDPAFNLHGATLNTGGAAVMAVVNGPIVHEIGLNSGVAPLLPGQSSQRHHRAHAPPGALELHRQPARPDGPDRAGPRGALLDVYR